MIRAATPDDLPLLHALSEEFAREIPPPEYDPLDWEQERREIEEIVGDGVALLAEQDGEAIGFLLARRLRTGVGFVSDLYVRPAARRSGIARALVREAVDQLGTDVVRLDVLGSNADARAVYERWGFEVEQLTLVARAGALEQRLSERRSGPSFGSIHVQTDDRAIVEREVGKFVPRLGRSAGTEVSEARNGWVAVYDELCDREPKTLQRLARELSYATGAVVLGIGVEQGAAVRYALYDRGGVVDEYLSVPEFYGPLPPGDVVALGANPTVVARLTGAEPARVRAVARTAASPDELPPAEELLARLAETLGVAGADRGWVESS